MFLSVYISSRPKNVLKKYIPHTYIICRFSYFKSCSKIKILVTYLKTTHFKFFLTLKNFKIRSKDDIHFKTINLV